MEPTKLKVLNLGCGMSPLEDTKERAFHNMDIVGPKVVNKFLEKGIPFIRHNLLKTPWPFNDGWFDEVYMFHTIEHIPENWHPTIAFEWRRVLKDGGKLIVSYPEFTKIATNYINNVGNDRKFWRATIYGRGLTEWDRHKALMDTPVFIEFMDAYGFKCVKHYPEPRQTFNTVCIFKKGELGKTYEGLMEQDFIKK